MKTFGEKRNAPEINAGSMADIAFLLLIFFLVTTTIMSDKGILVNLPPYDHEPPVEEDVRSRNLFRMLINQDDQLLARGELIEIGELRNRIKTFILNPQKEENLAAKPTQAVVSLRNDRGTSYKTYLEVYNELKGAYREIWEEQAEKQFGADFTALSFADQRFIKKNFPLVISESEPTDIAQNE